MSSATAEEEKSDDEQIVIAGGGLVGLVLALALHKHVGVTPVIYEKVPSFQSDVGAGMGFYANGLRVIRDTSPALLDQIREAGYPYLYRRWERHDGTEVAVAEETVLSGDDDEIQSLGIRRWRLQKILYEAVLEAGIQVHFGKEIQSVREDDTGLLHITFEDGTTRSTHILFGADGCKSTVRKLMNGDSKLEYTGVTCVMGMAESLPDDRGICFPSSLTSKCHGCFFPTSEGEQCFQMHFPVAEADADEGNWGTLSQEVGVQECLKLSERMEDDGWASKYITPLHQVTHAVRIGFCSLQPPLQKWVYADKKGRGRLVLVGDAAHPPVPYTGQGAQMGLEDAGTIAMLLSELCLDEGGRFNLENFAEAMTIYERIRIPRTLEINKISKSWGETQAKRAKRELYRQSKEEKIRRDVFFHETLPILIPGSTYNYREAVSEYLTTQPIHLSAVVEE